MTPSDRAITPRTDLDFGLTGDITRYWFGGDPFKTRLFDAHSLLTPAGERFFINAVREYREEIVDPVLKEEVKAFILQEGQHSMQHAQSNNRLTAQGFDVESFESQQQRSIENLRRLMPRRFALALTAAYEHLTTIVANAVAEHSEYFSDADPRIFALYAWHCIEELEHKAVAFDVMQKVAKVGYFVRIGAMLYGTLLFQWQFSSMLNRLFRFDGFSLVQRLRLWRRGLGWMYGRDGFFRLQLGHYVEYFRPGFHPSQAGGMQGYMRWVETFKRTADPIAASRALRPA